MTQFSEPTPVNKRKRPHSNSIADCSIMPVAGIEPNNCSLPSASSQSPTRGSTEEITSHNNNCPSSKSYLEIGLKTGMDNTGEYSYSGKLLPNEVLEERPDRNKCMEIIRNQGLTDRDILTRKVREDTDVTSDNYCLKSCKRCRRFDSTANMLICDRCEDAFHLSCSNNLKGTKIPVGEWFCNACLKKKRKILKEKRKGNTDAERIVEPYMTSVRIGDDFQADVPAWSGPVNDASDLIGTLANPANHLGTQQTNSSKLNSKDNWLQCQEVVAGTGQGVDEPICGKWLRSSTQKKL